jgi:rSAM/selenodomain-associated transferase 1
MSGVALVVIAKEPLPGQVKTRLCPPCRPHEAAALAAAALSDTLETVAAAPARRRVLALDGRPAPSWLAPGFDVIAQAGGGLGERLGAALMAAGGPALVVGMDTPQLTPALLATAAARLMEPGVDAVLGPALDGGYWTIGLRTPDPAAFDRVPMSSPRTGAAQRARLSELGLATAALPALRDVDTIEDARAVADAAPHTRFAATLAALPHAAHDQHAVTEPAARRRLQLPDGVRERRAAEV